MSAAAWSPLDGDFAGAAPSTTLSLVPAPGTATEARVLIVDDDDAARSAAAEALRAVGFVVEEVSNGLDALKAFRASRPHIALLEVMTPFVDGYSTCRAMRDLPGGDEASIVMMTDLDDIESLRFGYDAGATDFITKPVNAIILQHRVRYMLRAADVLDELRRSERRIAHLAYHDALTGLPNRRSLAHYMKRLTEEAPNATAGAVFLLDLDGFKRVNDTFGHGAGDELICEVGRRLTESFQIARGLPAREAPLRPILARIGGDEFVFIDPFVEGREDAAILADRMLAAVGSGFQLRGHEIAITVSIGVALVADVGVDIELLIQSADAAMYDAKAHDRNNARFFSRVLSEKARKHLDIENALRHPDVLSQFELFYQPKVDIQTSQIDGAEALIRWRHPERGLVPPNDFIAVAEETGLIIPIGRWVVREACRQARAWQDVPGLRGLRVAVNVSARQFRDPNFFSDVAQILRDTCVDPNALEFEITEGTIMHDTKAARALLDDFKKLGIWIALDDFGTGYSSLGYLRQFPFDTLKVDRSFITDVLVDDGCAAITSAIVAMANRLQLNVVAEGVETEGQLEWLRALGCNQVQGYFFSRPLPVREFEEWATGRVTAGVLGAPRQLSR
jgi:diguanylate cyclase (GGDEF)-like protein